MLPVDDDDVAFIELEHTVETAPLWVPFLARDVHLDTGAAALPLLERSVVRAEAVVVVLAGAVGQIVLKLTFETVSIWKRHLAQAMSFVISIKPFKYAAVWVRGFRLPVAPAVRPKS